MWKGDQMSLYKDYQIKIKSELKKELNLTNDMMVPKLVKIVINTGTGDAIKSKDSLAKISDDLGLITGQKPKVTKARVSIAGFNIRAGMNVGLVVTLRGKKMYDFYEKLVKIVLPRLRDFRGVPIKSFDKAGNYTIGITEHTVFPEVDLAKVEKPRGMEITIVTSTKNKDESRKLLELLGMPFEKETK
jgi:large subunit ribosomal protein L5